MDNRVSSPTEPHSVKSGLRILFARMLDYSELSRTVEVPVVGRCSLSSRQSTPGSSTLIPEEPIQFVTSVKEEKTCGPCVAFSHQYAAHTTLELEMSTIEVSEQVEESPAEAALKIEARIYGLVAPYTDEQLKAIRPIPMLPGDRGPFGPPNAYHIPFRPIADPAAAAGARERRRKMFALTKAAFPDLRVPTPFVSVRANEIFPFPMPFVRASLIKPCDEDEDSCTDIFDTWCLWDTGAQSSMILSRMLSKEVKGGEEEGYASLVIRFAGTSNRIETSVGFRENLPNGTNFVILGQHMRPSS
ncbi:hypothetical protein SCLCIDRAFT_1212888 [Scleroderma citrinum Foug A]|uniref:Uncharacterized protein n=1 Tax=Scleroderma citrinum Foug A TaxID=1036808 RepID=A0A0C3E8U5_9AGAM|nr:hypothetical protein SCLCIDRAFT_1212888 [Scleroderma citrinum Foug A]